MKLLGFSLGSSLPFNNLSASELDRLVLMVLIVCVAVIIHTLIKSAEAIIITRMKQTGQSVSFKYLLYILIVAAIIVIMTINW